MSLHSFLNADYLQFKLTMATSPIRVFNVLNINFTKNNPTNCDKYDTHA